jgi:lipid II:glycine glycyltransferase (peptidoglycan interpeptide bridge formation enzyme)
LTVRDLDDAEWAALIAADSLPSFLQSQAWGDLKTRFGWRARRLGLVDGDGVARAGLQLLLRTMRPLPLLPGVGVAYVPRGPLGDAPPDALRELLAATIQAASRSGASFLRIEPPAHSFATLGPVLAELGFARTAQYVQIRATGLIALRPEEDEILAGFKSKTRYNIRLSERRGVELRAAAGADDLNAFHAMTVVTGARDGFAVHGSGYYAAAWEAFQPDAGRLLIATVEGEDVGALFVVRSGGVATYLYGASTGAGRRAMPNYRLQWAAMRWAREQGCHTYDLWGMIDPEITQDPMAGVHRFKQGFQPDEVLHPGAYDQPLNRLSHLALTRVLMPARAALQRIRAGRAGDASPF